MSKPKTIKILAKDLQIYDKLVEELKNDQRLCDFDFSSIQITIKSNILHKIRNIDKVISKAERYISKMQNAEPEFLREFIFTKTDLSQMFGISRATVDEWIEKGFIYTVDSKSLPFRKVYSMPVMLEHLKKLQTQYNESE